MILAASPDVDYGRDVESTMVTSPGAPPSRGDNVIFFSPPSPLIRLIRGADSESS